MRKRITGILIIMGMCFALVGCGNQVSDDSYDSSYDSSGSLNSSMGYMDYSTEAYTDESYEVTEESEATLDNEESISGSLVGDYDASDNRKMITTVSMTVETEEFKDLLETLENKVKELNGYMESYETGYQYGYYDVSDENMQYASLTVRIPEDKLDSFTTTVKDNSNIVSQSSDTQDVTLDYVDTESHKEALEIEYDSLLELLAQAENVESIIALQTRLAEVRYEIESMESQLRTYDNKINYSTIYLYIDEVNRITPVITKEETTWDKISSGFSESIYDIGNGIVNFFIRFVIILPYLAILLVFALMIIIIIRLILKHDKKKRIEREKAWQTIIKQDSQH